MEITCTNCENLIEISKPAWRYWKRKYQNNQFTCGKCRIISSNTEREWLKPSKESLNELYYNQKLSQNQIGMKLGLSSSRIGQLLREYNIKQRSYAEASSNMNNQKTIVFDNNQKQLILGSMLGDANLHHWTMISNKKSKSKLDGYRLTFAHSVKQIDYLTHKKSVIGGSKIGERVSGHGAIIKHFSFCHSPSLQPYATMCLNEYHQKQVVEKWLNEIDWLGLAYWYMDDGSLIITKNKNNNEHPQIEFHTESFSNNERELLRVMLVYRFGLHTSLRKCNGDPNQQKIVSKHKHEVAEFLTQLQPYIIPSMQYKIRWIM